jgi:hypothetical protein
MADINNPERFLDGRWAWVKFGYDKGFPRRCTFSDLDAITEFDGYCLGIEAKHHSETDIGFPYPDAGQMGVLRDLVRRKIVIFVLYGDAQTNDPHGIRIIGENRPGDKFDNWLPMPLGERRRRLKQAIDEAVGLAPSRDKKESASHEDRPGCGCEGCIQKRFDSWGAA